MLVRRQEPRARRLHVHRGGRVMTQITHSAAPWVNAGRLGYGHWICAADGTQIAVFYGTGTNPKAEIDIRVAVAAPDMLAALRHVLQRCNKNGGEIDAELVAEIESAVAKAEAA